THLAGWINRKGVWFPRAKTDAFADVPQAVQWKESPRGQHIELGIAEHNLFLMLGALGLTRDLSGVTLLPIGTLYDPFVTRGLDALYHALYAGGRFIVAATPSGVSLAPEGGAHQSVITPGIGVTLPAIACYEPVFGQDVEWILLHGLRRLLDRRAGESLYLRLSTRPVAQDLAPPPSEMLRRADVEDVPVVSVLDGHSHALGFLGGALGVTQVALGVDDFGQSGARADLYRHYGVDADAIGAAARTLLAR